MPKLGDIVTYMTNQGQPRVAFVSAEVVELPTEEEAPVPVAADQHTTSAPQAGEPYMVSTDKLYTETPGMEVLPIPVAGEEHYIPTATPDATLPPEQTLTEEEQAAEQARVEAAQAAHLRAEAQAGGPIQRVEIVTVAPVAPVAVEPIAPPVEKPTGPALTLHVLLHSSDADYAQFGAFGIYSDVPHSDACVPCSWH